MAQVNFEDIKQFDSFGQNEQSPSVGFFSLKNDGDEAIVRIMHDSIEDFDILTTHPITVDGKHRRVSCVRDAKEPLDKCPLCASGAKVEQRIYIHLLQYTPNAQGGVVVEPKVWERSIQYAITLNNLIAEYGPLSNCLFKIKRNGVAGSKDTTYAINYALPTVYPNDLYPNRKDLLEGYKALGRAVKNKTAEEISYFLGTGSFPVKANKQDATPQTNQVFTPKAAQPVETTRVAPWNTGSEQTTQAPQAPARYY